MFFKVGSFIRIIKSRGIKSGAWRKNRRKERIIQVFC